MSNADRELKENAYMFEWLVSNFSLLTLQDQITFLAAFTEMSNKVKPIYIRQMFDGVGGGNGKTE